MATRAALFTQNDDGSWMQTYSHYDGYPEHMTDALAKADPDAIRAAREVRRILHTGEVDAFENPRDPETTTTPTMPEWAEHAYALTATGWQHAQTQEQLEQATAA
jgi:hypothetical protein